MNVQQQPYLARAGTGEDGAVVVLHWPMEDGRRRRLAEAGIARILVLPADAPPPAHWDAIEDWVREPVDREELAIRCATVARRRTLAGATGTVTARGSAPAGGPLAGPHPPVAVLRTGTAARDARAPEET